MNIAFCSTGCDLNSSVDERFGRTTNFLIYKTETGETTCIENRARTAKGGAGALAVQQLVDNNVSVIIAPEVGPQAMDALKKFNITAYNQQGASTVKEALDLWKEEKLSLIEEPGNKGLHKA
ncbi:NifB/NifX family molybdenum-iron cluster-binding protein [Spirochaeta isovalerica]|uniref:Putative Fe-Mo cluster-binding NifX family protein n=1 Tax=Spirochaeta isovalerica TaxID=150 RepID=A0A841RG80_9SPIO|nr:NifB/NifX family molybdenum-iron cluster-binding protein [Spirochaeta isovalerica]MBB6481789.1 putative Fe-Mo cluster-binding NifX family protein [Spirochaeta isovalerica]